MYKNKKYVRTVLIEKIPFSVIIDSNGEKDFFTWWYSFIENRYKTYKVKNTTAKDLGNTSLSSLDYRNYYTIVWDERGIYKGFIIDKRHAKKIKPY